MASISRWVLGACWCLPQIKRHLDRPGLLVDGGRDGTAIGLEAEGVCDQTLPRQLSLEEMPDHKIEGVMAGSVRGFGPEGVRPDELDLLVPDRIEVDVEELEVDADQHNRSAGANPAQAVGEVAGGPGRANTVRWHSGWTSRPACAANNPIIPAPITRTWSPRSGGRRSTPCNATRSEERRVGEEGRARWAPSH